MTQADSVHSTPRTDSPLLLSTDDDQVGMRWWNALNEECRRYWMRRAGDTGRAVDAWRAFKGAMADSGFVIWEAAQTAGRDLDPLDVIAEILEEHLMPDPRAVADAIVEHLRDAGFVIKPTEESARHG